jgi:hypothetical protein
MGLFTAIFLAPLAPVRGVIALGEVIERQVQQELHNPARARRQLEELQEARERGEISAEDEAQGQGEILASRTSPKKPMTPPPEEGSGS